MREGDRALQAPSNYQLHDQGYRHEDRDQAEVVSGDDKLPLGDDEADHQLQISHPNFGTDKDDCRKED